MKDLVIKVETNIASCNLDAFKAQAQQYLANLHDSYETDEDFAILTSEVKELKELEDKTRSAIEAVLNGNKEVETIINEARNIAESFRQERLSRNKLVTDKSNEIKQAILDDAFNDIKTIVSNQDSQLITAIGAKFSPQEIKAKLSEAIKGKRTISSIQAAVNAEKNGIVVEITTEVSRINSRLRLFPKEFDYLFNDAVNLAASQATDDELTSEIQSRIDADKARQAEIEAKVEEEAKAKAEKERLEAQPVAKEEPKDEAKEEVKEQAKQADEEHKEEPVARVEPTNRSWTVVIKLKPNVSREQAIELAKAFKEQHVELIEAMKLTNEE